VCALSTADRKTSQRHYTTSSLFILPLLLTHKHTRIHALSHTYTHTRTRMHTEHCGQKKSQRHCTTISFSPYLPLLLTHTQTQVHTCTQIHTHTHTHTYAHRALRPEEKSVALHNRFIIDDRITVQKLHVLQCVLQCALQCVLQCKTDKFIIADHITV